MVSPLGLVSHHTGGKQKTRQTQKFSDDKGH